MKAALLLVAVTGCDKLLSLSHVDPPAPDAAMQAVTGDMALYSTRNDMSYKPIMVSTPVTAADISITGSLADGTPFPVVVGDGGAISFGVPLGATYNLVAQLAVDAIPTVITSSATTFAYRAVFPDRPGAVLAEKPTTISMTVTNPPATGTGVEAAILSTGVRAWLDPTTGSADDPVFDWSSSGRGMLDASQYDEMYYVRGQVPSGLSYVRITDYFRARVTLVDGQDLPLTATSTPMAASSCVHLESHRPADGALLHQYSLGTTLADSWSLWSLPVPDVGMSGALPIVQTVTTGVNDDLDVVFGSPLVNDGALAAYVVASATRSVKLPTAKLGLPLTDQIEYTALATPSASPCPTNIVAPDATPIALLSHANLAGTDLTTDGQEVMIDRSAPVPFAYELSSDNFDDVLVSLFEVATAGLDPNTQTSVVPLRQYLSPSPVNIDPSLLAKNHHYLIIVTARIGFPNARSFDYRTIQFPVVTSRVSTARFQIAN